jgi:hypothetical protein
MQGTHSCFTRHGLQDVLVLWWPFQHRLERSDNVFPVSLHEPLSIRIKVHRQPLQLDELVHALQAVADKRLDPILVRRNGTELGEGDTRGKGVLSY